MDYSVPGYGCGVPPMLPFWWHQPICMLKVFKLIYILVQVEYFTEIQPDILCMDGRLYFYAVSEEIKAIYCNYILCLLKSKQLRIVLKNINCVFLIEINCINNSSNEFWSDSWLFNQVICDDCYMVEYLKFTLLIFAVNIYVNKR